MGKEDGKKMASVARQQHAEAEPDSQAGSCLPEQIGDQTYGRCGIFHAWEGNGAYEIQQNQETTAARSGQQTYEEPEKKAMPKEVG